MVDDRVSETNALWECLLCNLPEDTRCEIDEKLCKIQSHLDSTMSDDNPLYMYGHLYWANFLMRAVMVELGIDCMNLKIFTEVQNHGVVHIEAGEIFYIELDENPSIGHL